MDKIDKIIKDFLSDQRKPGRLSDRIAESDQMEVPAELVAKVRSQLPQKEAVSCPYCHKAITPFKKPLSRQKLFNLLWLAAGIGFFGLSFLFRKYFIQWTVLGALCVMKWIVDQKATKTQIMIYKAMSEESAAPRRFNLEESKK